MMTLFRMGTLESATLIGIAFLFGECEPFCPLPRFPRNIAKGYGCSRNPFILQYDMPRGRKTQGAEDRSFVT